MNTNTKSKGEWNEENKWRNLEHEYVNLLNGAVYYLENILSNQSKYTKDRLSNLDYIYDGKPTKFGLYDEIKNETWVCSFYFSSSKGCEVYMNNKTTDKGYGFTFPYKKLKTKYWREKISTWVVEETFRKILPEEEVQSFMSYKCIFKNAYNFIVYE